MDGSGTQSPPVPAQAEGRARFTHQQILRVITGILLCIFLAAIDQTVVIPAVPAIAADLNGFSHLAWIVSAYLLTSTAMTPIYGKLSDIYGRRILLLIALAVFFIASALCAMAANLPQLIVARALQGVGGGRADGDGPGGDRRRGQPAGAWPLPGLHGLHLGHRLHRRADHRRLGDRPSVVAVDILDQSAAGADRHGAVRPRAAVAAAAREAGADRLGRRRTADRRDQLLAAGAELGRRGDALAVLAGLRRSASPGSCCSSR